MRINLYMIVGVSSITIVLTPIYNVMESKIIGDRNREIDILFLRRV